MSTPSRWLSQCIWCERDIAVHKIAYGDLPSLWTHTLYSEARCYLTEEQQQRAGSARVATPEYVIDEQP